MATTASPPIALRCSKLTDFWIRDSHHFARSFAWRFASGLMWNAASLATCSRRPALTCGGGGLIIEYLDDLELARPKQRNFVLIEDKLFELMAGLSRALPNGPGGWR